MSDLLQRSILLTIGAAALTMDMAESLASEMVKRGQETREEGRQAVEEFMERARDEARSFRGSMDESLKKTLVDMGIPSKEEISEMELKLAQLEHRLSLLENGGSSQEPEEES